MTILEPLQWTHSKDLSRNRYEAEHHPFSFTIIMDDRIWFARVAIQGHDLGLWRIDAQNEFEAKAMLERWRIDLIKSQLTPEARQRFIL